MLPHAAAYGIEALGEGLTAWLRAVMLGVSL